jgi:hypothetical protein
MEVKIVTETQKTHWTREDLAKVALLERESDLAHTKDNLTQADFMLVPRTTEAQWEQMQKNRIAQEAQKEVGLFLSHEECPNSEHEECPNSESVKIERIWKVSLLCQDWLMVQKLGSLLVLLDPTTGQNNHVVVVPPCRAEAKKPSQHQIHVRLLTPEEVAKVKASNQKFLFLPARERIAPAI